MNKVSKAIKDKLESDVDIQASGVPVHIDEAPPRVEPPYIIIAMMSGRDEYAQQGQEVTPLTYLVRSVTHRDSGALGDRLQQSIKNALNLQDFPIEGMRLLKCWRIQPIHYADSLVGSNYYHNGGLFNLWVA